MVPLNTSITLHPLHFGTIAHSTSPNANAAKSIVDVKTVDFDFRSPHDPLHTARSSWSSHSSVRGNLDAGSSARIDASTFCIWLNLCCAMLKLCCIGTTFTEDWELDVGAGGNGAHLPSITVSSKDTDFLLQAVSKEVSAR